MHKFSLPAAALAMFLLLTLLRSPEVEGMERLNNLFNSNKGKNSKNYSKLNSSASNFSSPLLQSSSSAASSSASLPFNPLQSSSLAASSSASLPFNPLQSSSLAASSFASLPFNPLLSSSLATKSSAQFMPPPQQSTSLFRAPKPSLSSFSSLFKLKPSSSFFPKSQTGQSTNYQMMSNTLDASAVGIDDNKSEALANEESILFALTDECNKIKDKKKCKKASFTYFHEQFTCEWDKKQIKVMTGEIGWCTSSKESKAFFKVYKRRM